MPAWRVTEERNQVRTCLVHGSAAAAASRTGALSLDAGGEPRTRSAVGRAGPGRAPPATHPNPTPHEARRRGTVAAAPAQARTARHGARCAPVRRPAAGMAVRQARQSGRPSPRAVLPPSVSIPHVRVGPPACVPVVEHAFCIWVARRVRQRREVSAFASRRRPQGGEGMRRRGRVLGAAESDFCSPRRTHDRQSGASRARSLRVLPRARARPTRSELIRNQARARPTWTQVPGTWRRRAGMRAALSVFISAS